MCENVPSLVGDALNQFAFVGDPGGGGTPRAPRRRPRPTIGDNAVILRDAFPRVVDAFLNSHGNGVQ